MSKASNAKRKGMPTRNALYEYWRMESKLYSVKTPLAEKWEVTTCMACGETYGNGFNLDRAHILPIWLGGGNEAENIHLLCPVCHKDSEMMWSSPFDIDNGIRRYWEWFFYRTKGHARFSRCSRLGDPKFWNNDLEFLNLAIDCYRHDRKLVEKMLSIAYQCSVKLNDDGSMELWREQQ